MTRRTSTLILATLAVASLVFITSSRTGRDASREVLPQEMSELDRTPERLPPGSELEREPTRGGGFAVLVDDDRKLRLPLESVFVLPGESVDIRIDDAPAEEVALEASAGSLTRLGANRWSWMPPATADHADLRLTSGGDDGFTLRAWILVPRTEIQGGRLGSYRVGSYPARPLGGNPLYLPPPGLIRVTADNRDVRVSPHFTIGHFVSKQASDYPKYLILRPQLLLKLELLLDALVDRGYPIQSFHIMSGYRTPFYNVQVLGNVRYSRHQWGGAADIFVDERPKNGVMDDLDGDGRVGLGDIAVITEVVDSLEAEFETFPIGGAGVYRANSVRGPFVHIDVRGVAARW